MPSTSLGTTAALQPRRQWQLTATARNAAGVALPDVVTWHSSTPAVATVDASGVVTAHQPGMATITASCAGFEDTCLVTVTTRGAGTFSLQVTSTASLRKTRPATVGLSIVLEPTAPQLAGLDFPGNTLWPSKSPDIMLVWRAGVSTTPPTWTSTAKFTYIQRVYPREQAGGYWSGLFYSQWLTAWDPHHRYFGAHPYPVNAENPNPAAWGPWAWSISIGGTDIIDTNPASPSYGILQYDRWYDQVTIVDGLNVTYYWDWPNKAKVIQGEVGAPWNATPTDPAIIVGSAPWQGNEVYSGVIRNMQIYTAHFANDAAITAAVNNTSYALTPWYLNINPTPTDVTDKSGNGNHPGWANANRPALWQG